MKVSKESHLNNISNSKQIQIVTTRNNQYDIQSINFSKYGCKPGLKQNLTNTKLGLNQTKAVLTKETKG